MSKSGTLCFFYGKLVRKNQLNKKCAIDKNAVLLSEDDWLSYLYPNQDVNASYQLIFLNLTNEKCLRQIAQKRNEQLERADFDTEAVFTHVTNFFEAPEASGGLNVLEFSG